MEYAEVRINGKWGRIYAANTDRSIRKYPARCPDPNCHQRAIFCQCHGNRSSYFMSNDHILGCSMATGGKVKKKPRKKKINTYEMFAHKDKPNKYANYWDQKKSGNNGNDDSGNKDDGNDPVDNMTDYSDLELHRCSTIYPELLTLPLDTMLDIGLTVRDYIVDYDTIEKARKQTLTGYKMFVTTRTLPQFEVPPDYLCLRDAYTQEYDESIFVLVKCEDPTVDMVFRLKVLGDKKRGIQHDDEKYIVVTGKVERIPNDQYIIYKLSPLSEARYCLARKKKLYD